ncbi:MAG: GYD domain-containing protein [Chloroflexi bacterium]|nr:GYD domain-containing protein [Chloroflexota bacterium]
MAKYLFIGSYTAEGAKGVLKDGGSRRRQAATEVVESTGGTLHDIFWAFGSDDFYVIAEFPDHAAAAAASLKVGSSGAISLRTVVTMSAEDLDAAAKLSPTYTPPGG